MRWCVLGSIAPAITLPVGRGHAPHWSSAAWSDPPHHQAAFEQKSRPHALLELYARSLILVLRAAVIWSMIAQLGMSCPDLNVSSVKLL